MRIGLVTSEFPPDVGGVETYACQLAAEFGRRPGLTVTVYCPRASKDFDPPPNVSIKPCLSSCRGRDWSRLRGERIDVWHALSAPHAWLSLTGRPTVISVHGNDFIAPYALTARPNLAKPLLHRLEAWVWRRWHRHWQSATSQLITTALPRAHAVFANSHYTAEVLARRVPACASRIAVTWAGVDETYFANPRKPRGLRPRLLTVSRLSEPRKNVGLVLAALGALRERHDFEYTIAGDGSDRPALEAQARALDLAGRVRFAGKVDAATLGGLYAAADLFVLTSSIVPGSHEGFGIVYLEAAASGAPSLAARLAGAVDAVAEGVSGWFVDTPDVPSLTAALDDFLSARLVFDPARCRAFARRFLWRNVADAMLAHYPSVAARAAT
ncbi:MAG TPA: glycosyltransferase family 4 protein [Gammaproteobacteria bacterium]|nr:glycosyltransferase family 4 protein [Gammaproteobacteria bacterium]